jgi:hypothetical protein
VSQTHLPGSDGGGFNLVIPLILVLLALAAWALAHILRGRGEAAPAAPGAAPAAAPARPWRPHRRSTMEGPGWTETPSQGTESDWGRRR